MKGKLALTATAIALLALGIPALAFAQGRDAPAETRRPQDWLAIVAPRHAPADQAISLTVFAASDQTPVEGAGVWALSQDKADSMKTEMEILRTADTDSQEKMLGVHGTFLGRTDRSGKLSPTFDEAGRYLLVSLKRGFWPDARPIAVGVPVARPRLAIEAPRRSGPGEPFPVKVTTVGTGEAVPGAGVWALTREKAEAVKAEIESTRKEVDIQALEDKAESSLNFNGIFLGKTNDAGMLEPQPSLKNAGGYLLVSFKRGYLSAWQPILIGDLPSVLVLDAPDRAKVGEAVAITVKDRATGTAVEDAGVWALTREQAESLKAKVETLKQNSTDEPALRADIENALKVSGVFLGSTNGKGQLVPPATFDSPGTRLLVTYKPGSWPGMRPIMIVDARTDARTTPPTITRTPAVSGNATRVR